VVHAILDEIAASLSRTDRVEIRGFGVFSVRVGKEICRRLNRPEA